MISFSRICTALKGSWHTQTASRDGFTALFLFVIFDQTEGGPTKTESMTRKPMLHFAMMSLKELHLKTKVDFLSIKSDLRL